MPLLFNLTEQQKGALREVLKQFKERPTSAEYDRVKRGLEWLGKPPRRPTSFPHARSNWRANAFGDKWPLPTVLLDARATHADVPAGFAVYPLYDSAGTHAVDYAATVIWREVWNNWGARPDNPTQAGTLLHDLEIALVTKL